MSDAIEVTFGALAPSLKDQGFDDDDGHLQKDADAITRLRVRGLLTSKESKNAERRLAKKLFQVRLREG